METVNYENVVRDLLAEEIQSSMRTRNREISTCNRIAQILGWSGPVTIPSSLLKGTKRDQDTLMRAFKRHGVTIMVTQ